VKEKLVKTDDEHPALMAFKSCYAGHSIADGLAEQGYVVIVIDMFYWGERRMRLPDDAKTRANETGTTTRSTTRSGRPSVCWLTSSRDLQASHVRNTTGFTKLLPGLYRKLDMPDVVSLAAPRPLLNINGAQDRLFPMDTGIKSAYRTLETVYEKLGARENFRGHLYDAPHQFNEQMQAEAWSWLKKWV
jgi:hypothetical protein